MTQGGAVSTAGENRDVVEQFWADLYRQDLVAAVSHFLPKGEYTDIVTPHDDVARGPQEIAARLTLAFGELSGLRDERLHLVAGEEAVFTEHIEHWQWSSGESMALQVASVHELRGGKIARWCDYWDMNLLTSSAPQWWFEHVASGWK